MSRMTERIAEFCADVSYEQLPQTVVEKAKLAIIDTFGVIHTGFREPLGEMIVNWIQKQTNVAEATILAYDLKTTPSLAALANGALGHAIDYDDVSDMLRGHPSAVIFPATLAVAESEGKSGKDLITAFVTGVELMCRLGIIMNPSHYAKGWHSTATLGVMGAAVAVGKLYRFNVEEMKMVLGLAASMISGMRLNFGTMTKPFHVGFAARNAVEAAQLVRAGYTAAQNVFDRPMNVFELYSDETIDARWVDELGNPWSIVEPGLSVKRYPCCYATHRIADAAYKLAQEGIDVAKINKIECRVPKGGLAPLIFHRPSTGLQGKFSMEYVVSAMLLDKKIGIRTFTDEMVRRKEIAELIGKVELVEDESIKENRKIGDLGYVKLTVVTAEKIYSTTVYHAKGSPKNPLTPGELKEKFMDCMSSKDRRYAEKTWDKLSMLENIDNVNEIFN